MSQIDIEHARRNLEHPSRRFLDNPADEPALRSLTADLELAIVREQKLLTELEQLRQQQTAAPQQPGYKEFIDSGIWAEIREGAHERAGDRCQVCASTDHLHVHHNSYERFGGYEQPEDLVVLCEGCHHIFHTLSRLAGGGWKEALYARVFGAPPT